MNRTGQTAKFNFLWLTFICGSSRRGAFLLRRHTRRDRRRSRPAGGEYAAADSAPRQHRRARSMVAFRSHGPFRVPRGVDQCSEAYRHHALDLLRRSLRRPSQKDRTTWVRMDRLAAEWLPPPPVLHPWPEDRLLVKTRGRSRMSYLGKYGAVRRAPSNRLPTTIANTSGASECGREQPVGTMDPECDAAQRVATINVGPSTALRGRWRWQTDRVALSLALQGAVGPWHKCCQTA